MVATQRLYAVLTKSMTFSAVETRLLCPLQPADAANPRHRDEKKVSHRQSQAANHQVWERIETFTG